MTPAIDMDNEQRRAPDLYLQSLPPEFIRPAELARLQERIDNLRQALTRIAQHGDKNIYGRPNPNKIFLQAAHRLIIEIAEKALEQDDQRKDK
jgi:hypothetical protein